MVIFAFENSGYGAIGLGVSSDGLESLFRDVRNLRLHAQVNRGDREAAASVFDRERRGGVDGRGCKAAAPSILEKAC